jgi:hypothetical protein
MNVLSLFNGMNTGRQALENVGFPDDYCDILTTAKAGSLLGDGWTLPVIEHIFKYITQ